MTRNNVKSPERKTQNTLLFRMTAMLLALAAVSGPAMAAGETVTQTLISGDGNIGELDPHNLFSTDGGATFQNAYIIAPHSSYHIIPGTHYINRNPNYPRTQHTWTLYKTTFVLPDNFESPSLDFYVHADNVAAIYLNGTFIGQQTFAEIFPNFHNPPELFSATDPALFVPGENTIHMDIYNFYGPTAFDYLAEVSYVSYVEIVDIEVPVDIKPMSCPNPLNLKSRGVLPAAVLGTAEFDVTQVDVATISLAGVAPLRASLEDVATPYEPFTGKVGILDCTTAGPDGYPDLALKFDRQAVIDGAEASLGRPLEDREVLVFSLTGNLKEEFGGTPIVGEDVVVILKKEK